VDVGGRFDKMDENLTKDLLKALLVQTLRTLEQTPGHPKIKEIQARYDFLTKRHWKAAAKGGIMSFFKPVSSRRASPPMSQKQPTLLSKTVSRNKASPSPLYAPKNRVRNFSGVPSQLAKL